MMHGEGERPAPGGGAPTYAMLTAEARRQAALPRPAARSRREADVRRVPWWRVRTLRRMSGLSVLVPAALYTVLVLVVYGLVGSAALAPQALLTLVVSLALVVFGAVRLRGRGGASARALARAACAPGPVVRRYALLYDPPWGGIALLAVFPADGGDGVRPEAVLQLRPLPLPARRFLGARKLPADVPVEPFGELELCGRTDASPAGVPWIDGQAYWPERSYGAGDFETEQGRALMDRLSAGDGDDRWSPSRP
ncbi:hypothetical protein [Streptomyces sp. NPDC057694]|uniref:hypothetical protein n=1 Tax=Streptomyces sp. NPDC057694 TaxID=3346216 RepID=UPI003673DA16